MPKTYTTHSESVIIILLGGFYTLEEIVVPKNLNTVEHEIHACPKYSEFGSFAS